MTTTVIVKVPETANYVARVTTTDTATRRIDDVPPGAERTFYAHSSRTIQIAEAPIPATEVVPSSGHAAVPSSR